MKNKSIVLVATALFILPTGSALATETDFSGWIELGGLFADGADEGAKAQEYQDIDNQVLGSFNIDYYRDAFYFGIDGENIGLDDQSYKIKLGSYNSYKLTVFYDEIPHNLTFGARSFYSGIGTDNLTITSASPTNESTWTTFDYRVDRQKYGLDAEFLKASPFFVKVKVNREEMEGKKTLSSGGFGGAVELPEPVDYTTDTLAMMGGYRSKEVSFKLSGMYSTFDNSNNGLEWENPFSGGTEHNSMAQDSDYGRFGADLTLRQLPMMSTLMVKGSYANLSGEWDVTDTGEEIPTGLNTTTYDGDISTTRLSATLASRPAEKLDTRLFYSFYDRDNDSTIIEYGGGGNEDHLFDYSKNKAGVDVGYKLPAQTKISGGYFFEDVNRRNRPDADGNTDNQLYLKVKNSSLDFLMAKFEYTYLDREADEDFDLTGITPADGEYIRQFVDRFDYTSKTRHAAEFELELYPMDALDFGVSYTYVINDYDDTVLGRTEDTGHEFYVDVMWRAAKKLTLNGFAGFENYESDSNSYNHRAGFNGQTADPTVSDGNPDSFLWNQSVEEDFWTVGLGASMPFMRDRLVFTLLGQYQESDGSSDFTTQGTSALEPIDEFEDYYITTFEAKATFAVTEMLALKFGYLYKKSNYDDDQYNDYDLSPGGIYLSGANADHDYEAHVGYVTVKYSF